MSKLSRQIFLAIIILFFPHIAMAKDIVTKPDEKLEQLYIVTTTSQIGDLVKNIVKSSAKVDSLMGVGVDPHLYHPTRSDVSKIMRADIIFYNGMKLEGKMEDLLHKLAKEKIVISLAEKLGINDLNILDGDNSYDPHIWMDVNNWIISAKEVMMHISLLRPLDKNMYEQNKDDYTRLLLGLDEYTRSSIASIPKNMRILVTAHDAFGYLGSAYDIEVIGVQGISTQSEAGLKRIEEIVSILVNRSVPAIFIESSVSDHNIKAIIEGAKARGHEVAIGGSLYSDAMGEATTPEGTYIGMMLHNVRAIANALGGTTDAPLPELLQDGALDDKIAEVPE